jgi:glycosyltransferase involved in cell wall biosynthesis
MQICFVFDCLYPYTVGGAERWYRGLAEQLAARGHDVTYLTLLQWDPAEGPGVPGVEVIAIGPRMRLYAKGRRSIWAQLRFGIGAFRHLILHGGRYDVVQTPALHVSLLAALASRAFRGFVLVVDWFEVWTREYWREYLGILAGQLGGLAQRFSARTLHSALCFSRLHLGRLEKLGHTGPITLVEGLYALADSDELEPMPAEPLVVFVGRHIPEKRVTAVVPAVALARERLPELRAEIFGDGPERGEVLRLIDEHGLDGVVEAPGFADARRVRKSVRHALCLVLPSIREGYGLVVVEAAAVGTPIVVVRASDNAAAELIEDGENGIVAASAEPKELANAILRVHAAGLSLRCSTREWFRRNRTRLSLESSVETILSVYQRG